MMRRAHFAAWVAAGAVALAVVMGFVLGPSSGKGFTATRRQDVRVLQYNVCGAAAACRWNSGKWGPGTAVARLVKEAVSFQPDIITVNEICLTQYAELKKQLGSAGWRMDGTYASSQNNVPNCGTGGSFGSAVLSRGDVPDDVQDYRRFVHTGGERYTNGGRTVSVRRGLLCAHTSFSGAPLIACTAHTYAKAPEQLREIRDWTAAFPESTPVLVAGDLNLPPTAPALSYLTARFVEADKDEEATAGGRKIDYIFGVRSHFAVMDGDAQKYAESDHAMLFGRFAVR